MDMYFITVIIKLCTVTKEVHDFSVLTPSLFFYQAQKERILIKGGIVVNDDDMIEADVFIESRVIK